MELIEFYISSLNEPKIIQTDKLIPSFFFQSNSQNNSSYKHSYNFSYNLTKITNHILASKMSIHENYNFSINISVFQNYSFTYKTLHKKGIMMRYFLKLNSNKQYLCYFLHPISGQIKFSTEFILLALSVSKQETVQIIPIILNQIVMQSIKQLKYILYQQKLQLAQINNQSVKQLINIKKILKIAPYYAWSAQIPNTNYSNKNFYQESRRQFYENKKKCVVKQNQTIKNIIKIYNLPLINKINYQDFTVHQQSKLKSSYLAKINTNPKSQLISQITLSQTNFSKLMRQQLTNVQCLEQGQIAVCLNQYPQQKIPYLQYQIQVLRKLPNQQYIGLPKYYIIKNKKLQTAHCVITNLTWGLTYWQFLQKYKNTISIFTKLHILHQILFILKYLTSHHIIYHNLNPKNLYVRKGLFVKATDFTNAYHHKIINIRQLKVQRTILPYISNYQNKVNNSFGNQKADVFSFGMLLYQTLIGKTPFLKKAHKKPSQMLNKLLQGYVIGVQKARYEQDIIIDLLVYLCFECIKHEKQQRKGQKIKGQNLNKLININQRPYLDWIIILIKLCIQIYRKI